MFGLGLYIFQGDDLPEKSTDDTTSSAQPIQRPVQQQPVVDPLAGIKNVINSANDVTTLMSLYLDHQGEIEANPSIKALLTQRKQQLQNK